MLLSTVEFVEWVKKYPILYDPDHEQFKDINVRDRIWEQIAMQTNEDATELKRKWKNLKDTYRKHIQSNLDEKNENKYCVVNWKWAKLMDQFKAYLPITRSNQKTNDNETPGTLLNESNSGESSSSNYEMKTEVYEFVDAFSPPQQQQREDFETSEVVASQKRPNKDANQRVKRAKRSASPPLETDCGHKIHRLGFTPTEMIFLGYAQAIEGFSPQRQAATKLKIAQIMAEQELFEVNEAD